MRKTLICAAVLAAGAITTLAQVYSQNIVGYYNVTVTAPGQTMIANQLNQGGNTLNEVIPGAVYSAYVKTFVNGDYNVDVFDGTEWLDNGSGNPSTTTVVPGQGFFYEDEQSASPYALTFVGEVPTGSKTVNLSPGQQIVAVPCPEALELSAANGFPQQYGMYAKFFVSGDYAVYVNDGTQWLDNGSGNPVTLIPTIGQGFFIENDDYPPVTYTWTHTYP